MFVRIYIYSVVAAPEIGLFKWKNGMFINRISVFVSELKYEKRKRRKNIN